MMEADNCQKFLELALGVSIGRVEISREKSLVYHPEYKGVRLDVFARDERASSFNVEMQMVSRPSLGKRSRFYHAHMDMELLVSGTDYQELPNACVIFICDFDPFGLGKYRYTFQNCCSEEPAAAMEDGRMTMFLSTCGVNPQEIPQELVAFLAFVKADLEGSKKDFGDPYVRQLQDSIQKVKKSREMGDRYMIFKEMLQEEWSEGRMAGRMEGRMEGRLENLRESILKLLSLSSPIPSSLEDRLLAIKDPAVLDELFLKAATAKSLQTFLSEAEPLLSSAARKD